MPFLNLTSESVFLNLRKIWVVESQGIDEKSDKKKTSEWGCAAEKRYPSHKYFYVLFSVIQFFFLGFSWSSETITVTNQKNTLKSLFQFFHEIIVIPLLCQHGLFIHTCVSKNTIVIKDSINPLQLFFETRQFFGLSNEWLNNIIYH